jgi:membrane protease YdiL (CAAX protease family)
MGRQQQAWTGLLSTDSWSTSWRCRCGYGNAGRDRCLMCGAAAPPSVQGMPGLSADGEFDPRVPADPDRHAGRKAGRTVALIIVMNLVLQVAEIVVFESNHVAPASAIRISLFTGLGFYALVAGWVYLRSAVLGVKPQLGQSKALVGAAEGFIVGGTMAILLFAGLRLIEGHAVLDPTVSLLTAQGSIVALLLGIVLIVVAAPVVEEYVFRGFLAEALRGRGKAAAVMLSAIAFSLAHLRLAQFRYYALLGIALALVYWRRGLIGSIAAHATFNGMLIVLAVAAVHGPAFVAQASTSTVAIPAVYSTSNTVTGDDLVAVGPLGARVEFTHSELPIVSPPAATLATSLAHGAFPFPPQLTVDTSRVEVIDIKAGKAISALADVQGKPGRLVMIPSGHRIWIAIFRSDGSSSSFGDFQDMLLSWHLPPAV